MRETPSQFADRYLRALHYPHVMTVDEFDRIVYEGAARIADATRRKIWPPGLEAVYVGVAAWVIRNSMGCGPDRWPPRPAEPAPSPIEALAEAIVYPKQGRFCQHALLSLGAAVSGCGDPNGPHT